MVEMIDTNQKVPSLNSIFNTIFPKTTIILAK